MQLPNYEVQELYHRLRCTNIRTYATYYRYSAISGTTTDTSEFAFTRDNRTHPTPNRREDV